MRIFSLPVFIFAFLCCLTAAWAWSKEDYELFDLVSALEAAEGKGTTFYSHLNIPASATTQQITKAYRKKSLELHPDKNPGIKNIHERFARLGIIGQILRNPERRERYNFFYKNGVPKWRGTGYYYSRFRPTLSHTVVFLILLTNLLHRLVLSLNYSKHQRRISYFEDAARSSAGVLGSGTVTNVAPTSQTRRRKVRVPMVEGNENAGMLELIVSGNRVFLPHDDGTLTPLSSLARPPSWSQTWIAAFLLSSLRMLVEKCPLNIQQSLPSFLQPHVEEQVVIESQSEDDEGFSLDTPTTTGRVSKKALQKGKNSRSHTNTPKDSPAATELESDADSPAAVNKGKKSKPGPGKASAMRKRKMGLKK
ncbi:hypothetical protein L204_102971 [Cryptococcus depauperatus]|nr:endoplasmic reticulum protein [Cryptococcus depauperatus CBS 7855]